MDIALHCHAGQPQQPGLAQRLPETDGAKVLPTSDQVGFYLGSTHQMAPQSTHPIKWPDTHLSTSKG